MLNVEYRTSNQILIADLTSKNHSVIKSLLELRKARKISSFWTSKWKILAKVTPESSIVSLNSTDDIAQKLGVENDL